MPHILEDGKDLPLLGSRSQSPINLNQRGDAFTQTRLCTWGSAKKLLHISIGSQVLKSRSPIKRTTLRPGRIGHESPWSTEQYAMSRALGAVSGPPYIVCVGRCAKIRRGAARARSESLVISPKTLNCRMYSSCSLSLLVSVNIADGSRSWGCAPCTRRRGCISGCSYSNIFRIPKLTRLVRAPSSGLSSKVRYMRTRTIGLCMMMFR